VLEKTGCSKEKIVLSSVGLWAYKSTFRAILDPPYAAPIILENKITMLKWVCQDLSNISNDEYSKKKTNFSGYQAPVERTISQQGEIFSEMGTAKKSMSWHGNLKDTDPEVENEN
ncbi:hypothetical protein QYM36_005560, partial [Artemia franciscana]